MIHVLKWTQPALRILLVLLLIMEALPAAAQEHSARGAGLTGQSDASGDAYDGSQADDLATVIGGRLGDGDSTASDGMFGTNLICVPPISMIDGVIIRHDVATKVVTVDLGPEQGAKAGLVFEVRRLADQGDGVTGVIGAVKITSVQPNASVAKILSMQLVDQFLPGDHVRRPVLNSNALGKILISLSFTKVQRQRVAEIEALLSELQLLVGDQGLIVVGDDEAPRCMAFVRPPPKHDKHFVQQIVEYLRNQNHVTFANATLPGLQIGSATQLDGADVTASTTAGDEGKAPVDVSQIDWKKRNRELMQGLAPDSGGVPEVRLAEAAQ